jgi:hypothetical protein
MNSFMLAITYEIIPERLYLLSREWLLCVINIILAARSRLIKLLSEVELYLK